MEGLQSEYLSAKVTVPPQDVGTADVDSPSGSFLPVSTGRKFLGKAISASLTNGQTLTVQFLQATDATGAGKKVLGDVVTYTSSGTTLGEAQVEANRDQLDSENGFNHIGLRIGSGTNGIVGAGIIIFGELDYFPAD